MIDNILRTLALTIVGLVTITVVRLLAGIGMLDDAVTVALQLVAIPVRLVGALLSIIGGTAASTQTGRGTGPSIRIIALLIGVVVLGVTARWWLRRRPRPIKTRSDTPKPAPPAPVPITTPPPPPRSEGMTRIAGWEHDAAAAAVRYETWLIDRERWRP